MIGGELGCRRFLDQPVRCVPVLFWPVFVHGVYDIALFSGSRIGGKWAPALGLFIAAVVDVAVSRGIDRCGC